MTYENYLFARLEAAAELSENTHDQQDHVSLDIPLFIRILELAREDIHSDPELHKMVERVISLKNNGVLSMDNYDVIAGTNTAPESPRPHASSDLESIKRLAGLR